MSDNQFNQINHFISNGKFQQALEIINSNKKKRILPEDGSLLKMYIEIFIHLDKGDFKKGSKIADEMISESQKKENFLRKIDAITGKIENIINLGLYQECFNLIKYGKSILKNLKNVSMEKIKEKEAYLIFLKGRIYAEQFDVNQALKLFQQSVEIRREINDKTGLIFSLLNLGRANGSIGNLDIARKYFKESLAIAEELDNEVGILWNLIDLGGIEYHLRNLERSISYAKRCLLISEVKGYKKTNAFCYDIIGHCHNSKGELNESLIYFQKSLDLRIEIGYNNLIAQSYFSIGNVYSQKGELQRSLAYYDKILEIPDIKKDQVSKPAYLTTIGKIHGDLGNFFKAKKYLLEALDLLKEKNVQIFYFLNFKVSIAKIYHYLITISINNKEFKSLNEYLEELYYIKTKYKQLKQIEQLYRLDKAIILMSSDRLMDKMGAETILKEITEQEIIDYEITIESMKHLCEMLIYELELTGDEKIIQEIDILSDKLINVSQSQYLYDLSAETYLFKAKISLLLLDLNSARLLLTMAQKTANIHGLKRLASKISNEHDSLLAHMEEWEEKIKQNIPLRERLKTNRKEFLFSEMVRYKFKQLPHEVDNPVYIVILSPYDGHCLYSRAFKDISLDDGDLISGFISAINIFGKEAFSSSGSIDRIKHGDYLIVFQSKERILFGYVFKGNSYSAISKLRNFIEIISTFKNLSEIFNFSLLSHSEISKETKFTVNQLVDKIFLTNEKLLLNNDND